MTTANFKTRLLQTTAIGRMMIHQETTRASAYGPQRAWGYLYAPYSER